MSEWLMGLKICAQDGATDDDVGVAMPQMDLDRYVEGRDLAETTESRPLCITDLFQNKSVAYF